MYMNITISNSTKAVFGSLSIGEIFMLNETDVCVKIDDEDETDCTRVYNTWNFRAEDQQIISADTKVTIPRTVNMEVIV